MEQYKARLVELQSTVSNRPTQNISASAEQTAQENTGVTGQELVKSDKSNISLTHTATNTIEFNRVQKLTEIVFSDALGVSFLKDPYWKQTVKNNTVTLSRVGPNSDNVITLIRFKGVSVTTEDSIRGSVTYYYDTTDKSWMIIELDPSVQEGDTVKPQPYIPLRYTKSGLPLLSGTSRYKTYVVVRGVQDFIIVNINGSGYTDILDDFVHEIRLY
jgi:hypothetical protein